MHYTCHGDLLDFGTRSILRSFYLLAVNRERHGTILEIDGLGLCKVDHALADLHVRVRRHELLVQLGALILVHLQALLALEHLLDDLVRVIVEHAERQEVARRILRCTTVIKHGRYVDQFEIGQVHAVSLLQDLFVVLYH